ncbi:DoxX family protein [Telmatospirillum sp.]|uniref:DoxX family protein n=1 Tax=Telmatospirillum sp. TaxID=2079197 RepID=UPI00283D4D66|nr:DoxX family protein [Telmatospirillum sp.]MDR3435844.1 DoxX family protein [Telmatospirillum sp.]
MLRKINQILAMPELGKLILRVSFGIMMLFHGWAKIVHGVAPIEKMLVAHGFPAIMAWGYLVTEVVAPACMVLGLWTRLSALIVAWGMVVATYLSDTNLSGVTAVGAWEAEKTAVYLFAAVATALLGSGRYAVRPD